MDGRKSLNKKQFMQVLARMITAGWLQVLVQMLPMKYSVSACNSSLKDKMRATKEGTLLNRCREQKEEERRWRKELDIAQVIYENDGKRMVTLRTTASLTVNPA